MTVPAAAAGQSSAALPPTTDAVELAVAFVEFIAALQRAGADELEGGDTPGRELAAVVVRERRDGRRARCARPPKKRREA